MADLPPDVDLSAVPVFPLPGVVLLPTAVMPLHIFEPRYRAMMRAALDSDRLIAMAMLSPGWQTSYHARPAIEPAVCVGLILSHEELPDGKFNLLLQGKLRAAVVSEVDTDEPFRRFELQPIRQIPAGESIKLLARQTFLRLYSTGALAGTPIGQTFTKLLESKMPTPDIADLIAFNGIEDPSIKQNLLADGDVERRVQAIVHEILAQQPTKPWPSPSDYRNPSVN